MYSLGVRMDGRAGCRVRVIDRKQTWIELITAELSLTPGKQPAEFGFFSPSSAVNLH